MGELSPKSDAARADYEALRTGAAYRVLDDRLIVRVTGDDRVSFMHGMCTADIKGLLAGAIAPALLLTEHAHVIADFNVWAACDALLIEVTAERWVRAREQLEKLLVADDVEFEELTALKVIDLEGPRAAHAIG